MQPQKTNPTFAELETIVFRFETAWQDEKLPSLSEFIPDSEHPAFDDVVTELIRSDIEFRWQRGQQRPLVNYLTQFEKTLSDPDRLSQVAYEDFRMRSQIRGHADPEFYASEFRIDTSRWSMPNSLTTRDNTAMTFAPGEIVAEFEIVQQIGQGAAGSVFVARQKTLANRLVAIKITQLSEEPEILAQLQHTNIVPVFSTHQHDQTQVFCMPLLGRVTLRDVIGQRRTSPGSIQQLISTIAAKRAETLVETDSPVSDNDKIELPPGVQHGSQLSALSNQGDANSWAWLFSRIGQGLQHAHAQGILHRDLKPDNILIADNGQPLILDFHLSKTQQSVALVGGTLQYMSPEHLQSLLTGKATDQTSDIFSFGVMLFETLTGRLPFKNETGELEQIIPQLIQDRKSTIELRNDDISNSSHALLSIALHCIEFAPTDRYQSTDKLCEDLERCVSRRPLRYAENRSLGERFRNWRHRHPKLTSATSIALLATALIASIALGYWKRGQRLERIEADQQRVEFVEFVDNSIPQLALPTQDHRHEHEQLLGIRNRLSKNDVESVAELRDQRFFQLAGEKEQQTLLASFGNLQYWLSDKLRRLSRTADPSERISLLEQATNSNLQAQAAMDGAQPGPSLQSQEMMLQQLLGKPNLEPIEPQSVTSIETDDDNFEQQFLVAASNYVRGESKAALEILEPLSVSHSNRSNVWLLKALAFKHLKRFDEAVASLTVCIGQTNDAWAHAERGAVRLLQKEMDLAVADYDNAIELDDQTPPYYLNRGLAWTGLKRFREAESDFSRAIELGTLETRVYILRSRARNAQGNRDGAIADHKKALELQPRDEKSWIARGVENLRKDPQKGLVDFQNALRLNPSSKTALENSAYVYSEILHDNQNAIKQMRAIIEIDAKDFEAIGTLGVLQARENQTENALKAAKSALALSSSPENTYRVAGIFALLSSPENDFAKRAVELLRQTASEAPKMVWSEMKVDPDLAPIHKDPEFLGFASRLEKLVSPSD